MYSGPLVTIAIAILAGAGAGDRGSVSSQGRETEVFFDEETPNSTFATGTPAERGGRPALRSLQEIENEDFWARARAAPNAQPWNPQRAMVTAQGSEISVFFDETPAGPARGAPAVPTNSEERLACRCQ